MTCCQTQALEILLYVRKLHERVLDRYEELIDETLSPRSQFLTDYLCRQEKTLLQTIGQSLRNEGEGILKAFVDTRLDLDAQKILSDTDLPKVPSTDDLSHFAFLTRDAIIHALKESARSASDRKVKELFLSLWRMEEGERKHLAMTVMQLHDL